MAITRARKSLFAGTVAIAATCLGLTTFTAAEAAPSAVATASSTDMPSAVEDFAYPGADKILKEQGLTLKTGDGHITFTDCEATHDIRIEARKGDSGANYCFAVSGKQGYLTMEIPDTFFIWTQDHPVQAKLTADGQTTVVNAPAAEAGEDEALTPVGESGSTGKPSVLVELRVTS